MRRSDVVVLVVVVTSVLAIAIPNLLESPNRNFQKRTMADMRSIAAALEARATDRTTATSEPAIKGEIVETYCWARVRVGGPQHAACGIECAKRGIPVAIVDAQTRTAYVLLPGRDKMAVPPGLIAMMGRTVTVRGEILKRGGTNFITVQSWSR